MKTEDSLVIREFLFLIILFLCRLLNVILRYFSGQTEKRFSDGSVEVQFQTGAITRLEKDGTEKVTYPDGTVVTTNPNGDKIMHLPNGQKEIHTSEHKVCFLFIEVKLIINLFFF